MSMSSSHEYADSGPDLSGQNLGDYQLLRRLGRGGMAEVYLAEQLSLGRQVAFKVLRSTLAENEKFVRRFHNEARAAASLVHANIVQIHEVGCVDGIHYIAQEYVSGQNLKQWLTRHRTADAATAVHIMRQVVAALSRAAQHGIIHRDIKPENIMLATTGEVKVADFGLARVTTENDSVDLTQVGVTLGTPLYMSPEQVEGRSVDPRSDLYSLGVTCYEMLAGRPPFEGDTALSVAVQHVRAEPKRLEAMRPDLPEGLCRIIHQLLAKQPSDRFASAAELMRALRAVPIEGIAQWSAAADEWDTPELLALSDARSSATLQLDAAMQSQARLASDRKRRWRFAGPIAIGIALGSAGAWWSQPVDLLTIHSPAVEEYTSAMEQYWHAYEVNSEEAWLAVEENFPQSDPLNRVYALKAKQRRAELYRETDQPELAMKLYVELAKLVDEEPQLAVGGLLGQANLFDQQGVHEKMNARLAQAVALLESFTADQQRDLVRLLDAEAITGSDPLLRDRLNQMLQSKDASGEPPVPPSSQ